jgi:hypothetical protein
MVTYFFRKPKYPIICEVDGCVFAAKSEISFVKKIKEMGIESENIHNAVDISGANW